MRAPGYLVWSAREYSRTCHHIRIVSPVFAYAVAGPEDAGYAIVTDRFVVLLSADAPPETVRAVHRLLDTPSASADAAIQRLSEPDGSKRFAVVEIVDPWTQSFQVNVRGDIRVDMGGASTTRFTWPEGDQLLTGDAVGVESLLLALGGAPSDTPTLPLRHGAVVANAVALDGVELSQAQPELTPTFSRPDNRPGDVLAARHAEITQGESEPTGIERGISDQSTSKRGVSEPVATTPPALSPTPPAPSSGDVEDKPARASAELNGASEDTHTYVASRGGDYQSRPVDLASLMANAPGHLWTLTLPDGNELYAAPQIVVGRRPWRSDPDETQTYYVKAPSPHREISGKHVEFTVAGGQLSARDLNSTNGTVVESPDRAPRLLRDGNATQLDVGDILDLGEGFRIVVGARSGD